MDSAPAADVYDKVGSTAAADDVSLATVGSTTADDRWLLLASPGTCSWLCMLPGAP